MSCCCYLLLGSYKVLGGCQVRGEGLCDGGRRVSWDRTKRKPFWDFGHFFVLLLTRGSNLLCEYEYEYEYVLLQLKGVGDGLAFVVYNIIIGLLN